MCYFFSVEKKDETTGACHLPLHVVCSRENYETELLLTTPLISTMIHAGKYFLGSFGTLKSGFSIERVAIDVWMSLVETDAVLP